MLRLVCTEMYCLCWDYFSNVCVSLSVCLSSTGALPPASMVVGLGAGIAILKHSKKVRSVKIDSVGSGGRSHPGFQELLRALIEGVAVLKGLCFSGVDLSNAVPLLQRLSLKCEELAELELCGVELGTKSPQWILALLLKHSKKTLLKLSIQDLSFSPFQPLPAELLSGLRCLSVSQIC